MVTSVGKALVRVAIVSILPAENVSDAELQADLRIRLNSTLFTVERIAILNTQLNSPAHLRVDDKSSRKSENSKINRTEPSVGTLETRVLQEARG